MTTNGNLIKRGECLVHKHSKCNLDDCGCYCHFRAVQFWGLSRRGKAKHFVNKLVFGLTGQVVIKERSSSMIDTFQKVE